MTKHEIVSVDTVGLEPRHARVVQNGHFPHLTISTVIAYYTRPNPSQACYKLVCLQACYKSVNKLVTIRGVA